MKKAIMVIGAGVGLGFMPRGRGEGNANLEYSYADQASIPAEHASLYTEQGGQFVLTGVNGIAPQASVTRLESALAKERNDHKAVKTQLTQLGRPVADVLIDLDRIPELEAQAQGKGNDPEAIEKIVKARMAPLERQITTLTGERDLLKTDVDGFRSREVKAKIKDAVVSAATTAKVRTSAIDDAVMYAQSVMTVDDSGNVVTKDGVGVTPYMTPADWLADMLPKRQHWLEGSAGGGSQGGRGNGHSGEDPYSADGWNISKQMQLWKADQPLAKRLAEKNGVDPLKPVRPAKK